MIEPATCRFSQPGSSFQNTPDMLVGLVQLSPGICGGLVSGSADNKICSCSRPLCEIKDEMHEFCGHAGIFLKSLPNACND